MSATRASAELVVANASVVTSVCRVVDDRVVDQVVKELNHLHGSATLDLALGMGRLIIQHFYRGDLTLWRRHRTKEVSFRKLAARADRDLNVSATTLYRSVALCELVSRVGMQRMAGLTMTHLRVVLGLPDDRQVELLDAAVEMKWSTQRFEDEIAGVRGALAQRRGRPPSPRMVRAVRKLVGIWKEVEKTLLHEGDAEPSLSEIQGVYQTLVELRERVEQAARRMLARVRSFPTDQSEGNS
jgi:hypothetical protein